MPVTGITNASIIHFGTTDIAVADISFRDDPRLARLKDGQDGYLQLTGVWGYGTVDDTELTAATPTDPAGSVYTKSDADELIMWDGTRFEPLTHSTGFNSANGYKRIIVPDDLATASEIIAQALPSVTASGSMREVIAMDDGPRTPQHPLIPEQARRLLELYK